MSIYLRPKTQLLLVIKVSFANIIQTVALFYLTSCNHRKEKEHVLKGEIYFNILTQKLAW